MVVSGAAQGIGRGVALAAAREGAQLVLADRAAILEEVGAEAQALGALVSLARVDLETYAGATALAETALREFGRIDVL
ncbi:MAG TPA: 1,6-dihydroxycyclohexa-2,4-diene-1-carboxylate dehydrogenase, partial [Massilia sp.]|nr:1,6-dihydroxycyclohexa-2,4-diene-1-carboxylate dehydrogenase [Massilia sp.]